MTDKEPTVREKRRIEEAKRIFPGARNISHVMNTGGEQVTLEIETKSGETTVSITWLNTH